MFCLSQLLVLLSVFLPSSVLPPVHLSMFLFLSASGRWPVPLAAWHQTTWLDSTLFSHFTKRAKVRWGQRSHSLLFSCESEYRGQFFDNVFLVCISCSLAAVIVLSMIEYGKNYCIRFVSAALAAVFHCCCGCTVGSQWHNIWFKSLKKAKNQFRQDMRWPTL